MTTRFTTIITGLFLLLAACTKTETVPSPAEGENRILSYDIVNVQGDPIHGVVNDQDSSITVYLPFYRQLITLEPEIKVPEGAKVSPESGTLIENLLEVFHTGRDIKYTVTAKDGSKKTYTLKIQVQQPDLTLVELSTATVPKSYTIDSKVQYAMLQIAVKGAGISENIDLLKMVLVDEAGKELGPLMLGQTNTNDLFSINIFIQNDASDTAFGQLPATGLYKVRLYSYARKVTMEYPIRINKL